MEQAQGNKRAVLSLAVTLVVCGRAAFLVRYTGARWTDKLNERFLVFSIPPIIASSPCNDARRNRTEQ